MNTSKDLSIELVHVTEPIQAYVVAWDGVKKVTLHQILNQFKPPRAIVESFGSISIELASCVYDSETDVAICHDDWHRRLRDSRIHRQQSERTLRVSGNGDHDHQDR